MEDQQSQYMIKQAMVMAAGFGTRMRPLTETMPKPLIPFLGHAMIDRCMELLRQAGVSDFVVNSHYLADQIADHFKGREDVKISHEVEILETGGGLKNALPLLRNAPIFVTNADVILLGEALNSLKKLLSFWDQDKMDCLLLLIPKENAFAHKGAGDYFLSDDGRIRRRRAEETAPYVFSSYRILHPRLLEDSPTGAFSMRDSFDAAERDGRLFGIVHKGDWADISSVEALKAAEKAFANQIES